MGPGGFMPQRYDYERVAPPKGFRDLPRYLKELFGGFFFRYFYIFGLVWKTGPWILIVMALIAIFQGVMPVVLSSISKNVINNLQDIYGAGSESQGFAGFAATAVMALLLSLFACRILNRVVSTLSSSVARIAGEKVVMETKLRIMEKAKDLDLASFDIPGFYEKLENANREVGNRPISIINATFNIISTTIELIGYIVILATAPGMWWATLVIVAVSIPSAIINFIYRRKNFNYIRHRSKDRRQMNYYSGLAVNKDLAKEVRMFGLADTFIGKYKDTFARYYSGLRKLILHESFWHIAVVLVSAATNCFFYVMIAMNVFSGAIKLGDYTFYTGAIGSIASAVTSLISISANIYEGTLFIDNLISFMKEKQTILPKNPEKPEHVTHNTSHTIEFKNVSFRYPGTERYVLKNINLTFRPGETVVLVGLNGAGKTTLIKLLTRLYDPTEGVILLDGKDLREYDVKDLYSMFGIIFQDFGKYAFTVSENIHFGDIEKPFDAEEIKEAARQSSADEYIEKLPQGYDTPLMRIFEAQGLELSGGQWQKLAIARAFYSNSDVLILDEPTAALDPMAEQEIFNQFDRLREDKTTIFVSHRLSSATVASLIVVLEYGEVVESGDHRTLMEKRGKYYELFTTQAKRYWDGVEAGRSEEGETGEPKGERAGRRRRNRAAEDFPV